MRGSIIGESLQLELQVQDDEPKYISLAATVTLAPEQWVILGAVGADENHNVFAVQRMSEQ